MKFQEKKKTDDEAIASLAVYQQVAQASKTKILLPPTLESKLSTLSPRGKSPFRYFVLYYVANLTR